MNVIKNSTSDREYFVRMNYVLSLMFICQCDTDDGISSDSESPTSIHSLIRQMQEKERQIMRLEADVVKVTKTTLCIFVCCTLDA
jgi:hypothetical protein